MAGDWTVTPAVLPLQLNVGAAHTGTFDVEVPALSDDDSMVNGAVYPVTLRILNATTQEELKVHSFRFMVAPLFMVEVENWPSTMEYHRGIARTWDVEFTNTGNKDVEVNLTYTLLEGGLTQPSLDWSVSSTAPNTLFLPRGQSVPFSFSITNVAPQPPLTLAANFILTLDPVDTAVQGSAEYYTDLRMDRFFEYGDTFVTPPRDNSPQPFEIEYSHIPSGPETAVAYELELCRAERLEDPKDHDANASESDFEWTFAIRIEDTDYPLNMSAFCGPTSLGPESRITLPSRQAWFTTDPIVLVVDTPNPPHMLPGDGWDLTFRLYHPDEHNGYTVYDEDVFTYRLAVFADPAIIAQGPVDPEAFFEGQTTQYEVTVRNIGTALAYGVGASLDCNGDVEILSEPDPVSQMNATVAHRLSLIHISEPTRRI